MKALYRFLSVFLTTALASTAVSFGSPALPSEEIENDTSMESFTLRLSERVPALMADYDIPGAIITLVRRGEPLWSQAYGYADLETGRKMTVDTPCRVESISKSLTAWGVMKLIERGKLDPDKPIKHYLKSWEFPKSRFSEDKVTAKLLLSQSAGMPLGTIGVRYDPQGKRPSLRESLSKEAVLMQEPGLAFSYSNTGFNLLELLVEEVTRRDFAEYMRDEVLLPLGMENSSFTWREDFRPPVPSGYDGKGDPIPVYVYPEKAAGGLFSTAPDIAAFIAAGMKAGSPEGNKVLSPRSIGELYTPMVKIPGFYGLAFDSYGLGHFIEFLSDGKKAVSHGGQGSGWMTHFHSVPETGDGIVILTNSQRSWPFFARILSDWADRFGYSPVGMGVMVRAEAALWGTIVLTLVGLSLWLWRLGKGLFSGGRRFAPCSSESRRSRLIQGLAGIFLLSGLGWALKQEYLFISSVFPTASGWLGFSIFLAAFVLLLSATVPGGKK